VGGVDVLGLWTWSTVLVTPLINMVGNVHEIGFPTLARLHEHHRERHGDAVALIARALALGIGATVGILAGFAPEIVHIVFSDRWLPAVGAVRAALFGGIAYGFSSLLSAAVQSMGRPVARLRSFLVAGAIGLVVLAPLVDAWGTTGGAVAIYLIVPAVDLLILVAVARAHLQRAFVNLAVVTTVSLLCSLALADHVETFKGLLLAGAAAGLVSGAVLVATDWRGLTRSVSFLRDRGDVADQAATA
jgi:O-antigen/teichoic acid export membrane protein